jgi:hypothetical protein
MPSWKGFLDEAERVDVAERHAGSARATFEMWALRTEERVLAELNAEAGLRALEFADVTGAVVRVEASVNPVPPHQRSRWRTVSLRLGASRVEVYSVRNPGESPTVHLAVLRGPTSTRYPVFATLPGALVIRATNDGVDPTGTDFELLALPLAAPGVDRRRTTIDALVLRAFDLLLGMHRSVRAFERAHSAT